MKDFVCKPSLRPNRGSGNLSVDERSFGVRERQQLHYSHQDVGIVGGDARGRTVGTCSHMHSASRADTFFLAPDTTYPPRCSHDYTRPRYKPAQLSSEQDNGKHFVCFFCFSNGKKQARSQELDQKVSISKPTVCLHTVYNSKPTH